MRFPLYYLSLLLLIGSACTSCKKTVTPSSPVPDPNPPETLKLAKPIQAVALCDYNLDETALTAAGWAKTFDDDFTAGLDKWNVWRGGAFNNELQYYQPGNVQIANGALVITAHKETVTGRTHPWDETQKTFSFTSGRLESKTNVSANATTRKVRMAARIKIAKGYGMWPAFWSYGDPWPTQGEIDILEARGQEPNKYQTNYFYGRQEGRNLVRGATGYITASEDLSACYHVYELVWEQNSLTSYLDGKQIEVKTAGGYIDDMFGTTQRITLNLAVGGAFFTALDASKIEPGTMYVDWVKVFTAN